MPRYEVFIPAKPGTDAQSMTVEVEAASWLLALRTGMKQIGEQGDSLASIMCENRPDGTVVVKDPGSRRMFRIKEIEAGAQEQDTDRIEAEQKRQEAESEALRNAAEVAAREREEAQKRLEESRRREQEATENARKERAEEMKREQEAEKQRQRDDAAHRAARAAMARATAEKELREKEKRAKEARSKAAVAAEGNSREISITRHDMKPAEVAAQMGESPEAVDTFSVDDVLADLFMDTMDLMTMDGTEGFQFILDLALRTIKAEAGSVILSDINSALSDLYFAAAVGRVADQLTSIRIPRGKGIVGFSVEAGCALAVSDVDKNPNFYRRVAEKTGFDTRSILCVPVQFNDRTYGAIELVNKVGSNRWSAGEVSVVVFLAQKLGEYLDRVHASVPLED